MSETINNALARVLVMEIVRELLDRAEAKRPDECVQLREIAEATRHLPGLANMSPAAAVRAVLRMHAKAVKDCHDMGVKVRQRMVEVDAIADSIERLKPAGITVEARVRSLVGMFEALAESERSARRSVQAMVALNKAHKARIGRLSRQVKKLGGTP